MITQDRSFPHPVLAPFRDDVSPNKFQFTLTAQPDADNYYLNISFEYDNATLSKLIDEGAAIHAIHLECRRNFFRNIFTFPKRTQTLTIKASELVGRVEVSGFIKAQIALPSYAVAGSHADYGAATFQIQPGDVLAAAESKVFDAFIDYDPLRNITSILTINRSDDMEEGVMKLDTTENRIVATLSQKDYDRYTDLKADPNLGPLLANQVVVPALLEAAHEIRNTPDDDLELEMSKRWFRAISNKLDEMGLKLRSSDVSPVEAVQALLKLPLRRSLEGLISMNPLEEQ